MKRVLSGAICLGVLSIVIMPISAQSQRYLDEPVREMEEVWITKDSDFEEGHDLAFIEQSHTYHLTGLDNRRTGRAIAREQIKQSLLDELIALIVDRAGKEKGRFGKRSETSTSFSYQSIANSKGIRALLPSVLFIEHSGEEWGERTLLLRAKATVAPERIASALSMIQAKPRVFDEINKVRSLAVAAMNDIEQMQKSAVASDKPARPDQNYLDAVGRLIAAHRYEDARYYELTGRPQEAIGAYTEAIEALPGLAAAYWNRGRLYLSHRGNKTKAASDFNAALQVYTSNAMRHMKSGEYEECISDIEAALKLNANYAKGYYQRAACRTGMGKKDGVREDFIRAAQLGDKGARDILTAKGIAW